MKSNILIIVPSFSLGGWATYAIKLSEYFVSRSYTVVIYAEMISTEAFELLPTSSSIKILSVSRRWLSRRAYIRKIAQLLDDDFEIGVNMSIDIAFDLFARMNIKKVITTIHSISNREIAHSLRSNHAISVIVAVSKNVKLVAQEKFPRIPECFFKIIHPLTLRNAHIKNNHNHDDQRLVIVWIGRIEIKYKRADRIIDFVVKLKRSGINFDLHIIGDGAYLSMLQERLSLLNAKEIYFHGGRSHQYVIDFLKDKADVIVNTSDYEGAPHVILEAMAFGVVPVVPFIPGSTDTLVVDGKSGFLVPANDLDSYILRIQFLYQNRSVLHSMSAISVDIFNQNFSYRKIYNDWDFVISSLNSFLADKFPINYYPRSFSLTDLMFFRLLWRSIIKIMPRH